MSFQYDKLHVDNSVYSYNEESEQVEKINQNNDDDQDENKEDSDDESQVYRGSNKQRVKFKTFPNFDGKTSILKNVCMYILIEHND